MLESIEIKNFRSCMSAQVRLGEPVVALLGKNGVGKTNVLHAIQLVADLCVGEAESIFNLHPRDHSKPTELSLSFSIGDARYSYRVRRATEIFEEFLDRNDTPIFTRTGELARMPEADAPFELRFGMRAATLPTLLQILPSDHSLIAELRRVSEYLRAVRYYSLLQGFQEHTAPIRLMGEAWSDASPFLEVAKYEAWKVQLAQGRAPRSALMRLLHLSLTDNSSFDELKTLLGDNGLGLLSDIRVDPVKLRGRSTEKTEEESVYAIAFVPGATLAGAGRVFRNSGLSAGTWRIVQLLTYLVFDKSSCMLVEQPEDSIHPGLLAKVVDILRTYSGRTQLICTTHSPRVMNLVGASGIRLVTSENGSTVVNQLSDEHLGAASAYLRDEGTLAEFLDTL